MGTCVYDNTTHSMGSGPSGCSRYCNVCNFCNTGGADREKCQTHQSLCTVFCQYAKEGIGEANAPSAERDDIIIKIFPQSELNRLLQWINDGSKIGWKVTSPQQNVSDETKEFIYADKINELIDAMYDISHNNTFKKFERDDIIYASDFSDLMDVINDMYINKRACDNCNTQCDIHCNTCIDCNICQYCNLCQGGNRCSCGRGNGSTCESCNTCQGCNSCQGFNTCSAANCDTCQNCNTTQYY